jgi:hypothetical protein
MSEFNLSFQTGLNPRLDSVLAQADAADGKPDGWVTQAALEQVAADPNLTEEEAQTVRRLIIAAEDMGLDGVPMPTGLVRTAMQNPTMMSFALPGAVMLFHQDPDTVQLSRNLAAAIDTNKDNNISADELSAALASRSGIPDSVRLELTKLLDSMNESGGQLMMTTEAVAGIMRTWWPVDTTAPKSTFNPPC